MTDPHIRVFIQKDVQQCCNIINKAAVEMDGLNKEALKFILTKNTPRNRAKEFSSLYTLVYTEGGIILGLGALDGNEIKRVYVDPSSQKKGIGSAILRALEQEARTRNIKLLIIEAQPNAVPFYSKLGYQPINETILKKDKAEFHIVNMEKSIE